MLTPWKKSYDQPRQHIKKNITLSTKVKVKSLSCVRLFMTPWTVAYQAPPSMGFARQEYRSGVPSPSLSGPITSWQIDGETVETVADYFSGLQKPLQMVIAAMKLKDAYSLEGKL